MSSCANNRRAFLDALAWSEGTDVPTQPSANRGYDVLVGGQLFEDYTRHPNILVTLRKKDGTPVINQATGKPLRSTAAGRYQFLTKTWNTLQKRLGLKDFSPDSQDAACLELLRECGALALLDVGDFAGAVHAAKKIWASLPGAGYGQKEHKLETLRRKFVAFGGWTN